MPWSEGKGLVGKTLEIESSGRWHRVSLWTFRSWTGGRRVNGETYTGPVYLLGTDKVAR